MFNNLPICCWMASYAFYSNMYIYGFIGPWSCTCRYGISNTDYLLAILGTSYENKSRDECLRILLMLNQIMTECSQATSYYMIYFPPRPRTPYCVTKRQCVTVWYKSDSCFILATLHCVVIFWNNGTSNNSFRTCTDSYQTLLLKWSPAMSSSPLVS